MPVIRNRLGTISYGIFKPKWPNFSASYSVSTQESSHEPYPYHIENETDTLSIGLSYAKTKWNITPNFMHTRFKDKASTYYNNNSETCVYSLSGGLRPSNRFSINPVFSYSDVFPEYTRVRTITYQSALSGIVEILPKTLNLNTTLSYLENKMKNKMYHSSTFSAVGQLNWHLEGHLLKKGKQAISLRGQYMKSRDHLNGSRTEDYSVYLVVSIGIPMQLLDYQKQNMAFPGKENES
jgi:hypothetical protein